MRKSVFISYSRSDAGIANKIAKVLDELKIGYFRDVKDIEWGQSVRKRVRNALHDCIAVVVIVSPGSVESQWVPFELGHASATRKQILPYLTHPMMKLPPYIGDHHYVASLSAARDYFHGQVGVLSYNAAGAGLLRSGVHAYASQVPLPLAETLTGEWNAVVHQETGQEGRPVDFPVTVRMILEGHIVSGTLTIFSSDDPPDECQLSGTVVNDRLLWVSYFSKTSDELRFGTFIGELEPNQRSFLCRYTAYGPTTRAPVTGYAFLEKKPLRSKLPTVSKPKTSRTAKATAKKKPK